MFYGHLSNSKFNMEMGQTNKEFLSLCTAVIIVVYAIFNYLANRKQRTKINQSFSSWENIIFRVPQGSILGPILFSIFIAYLLLVIDDIDFASYADDKTIY